MIYQKCKKMTDGMAGAFFTVEAAILYPLVLAVIVLMVYLLFFQYDRCLLDQDIGKAAVQNAGKWTLTKSGLDEYMKKRLCILMKRNTSHGKEKRHGGYWRKTILLWRKRAG